MSGAAQALVSPDTPITLRSAAPRDGLAIHRLVRDGGVLELNTAYCYVLLADHFRETTLVAERGEELVGFVAAYRPPTLPDAVFVWQVGVAPSARGAKVASRLLDALVTGDGCEGVRYLEATVDPANAPSRRLFESFAERRGAPFEWSDGYAGALFGEGHAPEPLIRVGPLGPRRSPS